MRNLECIIVDPRSQKLKFASLSKQEQIKASRVRLEKSEKQYNK